MNQSVLSRNMKMVAALEGKCQDQETLVAKLQSEKAMLEKKKGEDEKTKQEVEEKDALINEAKKENSKLSEEMSKLKEEVLARQLLVMQWEKESKSREAALKEVTEAKKSIEERLETIFKYPQLATIGNAIINADEQNPFNNKLKITIIDVKADD